MKFWLFLVLCLVSIHNFFCQNDEWNYYDVDSMASIKMPFIVYELDTIIDENRIYEVYSNDSINFYNVRKIKIDKKYQIKNGLKIPQSEKELKVFYRDLGWTISEMLDYNLDRYYPIKNSKLTGYQFIYKKDKIDVLEIQTYFINNHLYFFNYSNDNGLTKENRLLFFDSIEFNRKFELLQYPKKSIFSIRNIIFVLVILLLLTYIIRSKNSIKS